jgi:chromosome segregation ATPase
VKAIFVTASLCFLLFSGFLKGEQSDAPASQTENIAELRKHIETLEARIEHLEKRLDQMSRPRMVPLTRVGVPRDLP